LDIYLMWMRSSSAHRNT